MTVCNVFSEFQQLFPIVFVHRCFLSGLRPSVQLMVVCCRATFAEVRLIFWLPLPTRLFTGALQFSCMLLFLRSPPAIFSLLPAATQFTCRNGTFQPHHPTVPSVTLHRTQKFLLLIASMAVCCLIPLLMPRYQQLVHSAASPKRRLCLHCLDFSAVAVRPVLLNR